MEAVASAILRLDFFKMALALCLPPCRELCGKTKTTTAGLSVRLNTQHAAAFSKWLRAYVCLHFETGAKKRHVTSEISQQPTG